MEPQPGIRQRPCRAHRVVEPALSPRWEIGQAELPGVSGIGTVKDDAVVICSHEADPDLAIDGGGQHEPVVHVGVFADQVHAAGRAHELHGRRRDRGGRVHGREPVAQTVGIESVGHPEGRPLKRRPLGTRSQADLVAA